jgi:hypothetical protein
MAAQNCQNCGKPLTPGSAFCTACGTRVGPPARSATASPVAPPFQPTSSVQPLPTTQVAAGVRPRTCVNCKTQMSGMGQVSFRTGGYVGGTGAVLGSWNATQETLQPFSLYYCQQCGKFDLYYVGT